MTIEEAKVGVRIRTKREFSRVPEGTQGVIDEDYVTGVMVAWDLPDSPLPSGYRRYDGVPMFISNILRDGFDKKTDLEFLEVANA